MIEDEAQKSQRKLRNKLESVDNKKKVFRKAAQEGLQPRWEKLKRYVETWVARNPDKWSAFQDYREKKVKQNKKATGATESLNTRRAYSMPEGLNNQFRLLAPNFDGKEELTAKKRRDRLHEFLGEFPCFKTHKNT